MTGLRTVLTEHGPVVARVCRPLTGEEVLGILGGAVDGCDRLQRFVSRNNPNTKSSAADALGAARALGLALVDADIARDHATALVRVLSTATGPALWREWRARLAGRHEDGAGLLTLAEQVGMEMFQAWEASNDNG